jgi:hypothetical protein
MAGDVDAVLDHAADLGAYLHSWAARREPDPQARRAAGHAICTIDAILTELHGIRARLIAETRASDDQAEVRIDALLAGAEG